MPIFAPPPRCQTDRGRAFLSDHPLTAIDIAGEPGCLVAVRLTSYRSLPLSCIERLSLWIDDTSIDPSRIELVVGEHAYTLEQLPGLSRVWWFILDVGHLRVRLDKPLGPMSHKVRGELVTVEPYISNGRFHFTWTSERTLSTVDATEMDVAHV